MIAATITGTTSGVVVLGPSVLAIFGALSHGHLAEYLYHHRRHTGNARDRDRRHPPYRTHPGRPSRRRVHGPHRLRDRGLDSGSESPSRHFPDHEGVVPALGDRREGQPRGRALDRGVHVHRVGCNRVRQRGGQAPAHQPGPGRGLCSCHCHSHIRPDLDRAGGSGVTGELQANSSRHLSTSLRCWPAVDGPR